MAQQTAVQYLEKQLTLALCDELKCLRGLFVVAKEMDKQQHGQTWDAAIKAHDDRGHVHARSLVDFDEYYNKTYKK